MKSTVRIDFVEAVPLGADNDPRRWMNTVTVENVNIGDFFWSFDYAGHARVVPTHNIRMLTYESATNVEAVREPETEMVCDRCDGAGVCCECPRCDGTGVVKR